MLTSSADTFIAVVSVILSMLSLLVLLGIDGEVPPFEAVSLLHPVSETSNDAAHITVMIFFIMSSSNVVVKYCLTFVKCKHILAHI